MANFNQHLSAACQNHRADKCKSFSSKNAESKFLTPIGLSIKNLPSALFADNDKRFNYKIETQHFEALHFVKYKTYKCLQNGRYRLKNWSALYFGIRNRIISANIALLYKCLEKTTISHDYETLRGLGHESLIRAAEGFDPWRGYRFSTYACNAIYRAFCRVLGGRKKLPIIDNFDVNINRISDNGYLESQSLYLERLKRILKQNQAQMSQTEKTVIKHRFGFNADANKLTLGEIGNELCVSKERVRQIQENALKKLKLALVNDPVLQ